MNVNQNIAEVCTAIMPMVVTHNRYERLDETTVLGWAIPLTLNAPGMEPAWAVAFVADHFTTGDRDLTLATLVSSWNDEVASRVQSDPRYEAAFEQATVTGDWDAMKATRQALTAEFSGKPMEVGA